MKKNLYIAAACLALAACQITEIDSPTPSGEPCPFQKGQLVTLTVCAGNETKAVGTLNGATKGVDFTWETGDKILVKVGDKSSEFTLKGEGGSKTGYFVGEMPAEGNTFDVQYPITTPDLSSQTYSSTAAIPHDMMLATATKCTVGSSFTLQPQYAALRLNLYGMDREITQIQVTNTTASPNVTYTLSCPSVRIGLEESNATSFFVIVPDGTYSFLVAIDANALNVTPRPDYLTYGKGIDITNRYFSTTSDKVFSKGVINNMPAKCITTIWAPVNCGYDSSHQYGLLYQWGRSVGQGYTGETNVPAIEVNQTENPDNTTFYGGNDDWYSGTEMTTWPHKSTDAGYVASKISNPCPTGWRVPTYEETNRLLGGYETSFGSFSGASYLEKDGQKGHWFNGSTTVDKKKAGSETEYEGVFLPAAGARFTYYESKTQFVGTAYYRGEQGYYWSSSNALPSNGYGIGFYSNIGAVAYNLNAMGYSVRCIYDPNDAYSISVDQPSLTFNNSRAASSEQTVNVTCNKYTTGSMESANWKIKSYKVGASGSEVSVSGNTFTAGGITATMDGSYSRICVIASARENTGKGGHAYWTGSNGDWSPSSWSGTTDLSNFDFESENKSAHSMTTANCYVIRHAGTYKLPLVYGNGVVNGSANPSAYTATAGSGILANFLAHDGTSISSPFIEDKCKAESAAVVSQDCGNVVKDLSITGTYHSSGNTTSTVRYLQFTVDPSTVCQNNAVIAVKDASGNIIWSWHIWITNDPVLLQSPVVVTSGGTDYSFMKQYALGLLSDAVYPMRENVTITLCPVENEDVTETVTILQPEVTEPIGTVYQFGRKDPLSILSTLSEGSITIESGKKTVPYSIKNPSNMYPVGSYVDDWCSDGWLNLWGCTSTVSDDSATKTIYDPSPVGYLIPAMKAFNGFTSSTIVDGGLYFAAKTGTIFFPALSYRSSNGGDYKPKNHLKIGGYWSNKPVYDYTSQSHYLRLENGEDPRAWVGRAYGFSIRPVKE